MSFNRFNALLALETSGTESFADGQKRQELEYTLYGKLEDFSVLDLAAKKEDQEQWHIPIESDSVGMRLRKINGSKCIQTVKVRRDGVKGKEEVESEITEDMYSVLKEAATSGFKKQRYFFPVPNSDLTWEVDVFEDLSGAKHSWVKLDMEVTSEETPLPPLPFEMNEKIVAQGDRKTEEEKKFLDRLWNIEWNIKADKLTVVDDGSVSDEAVSPESEENGEPPLEPTPTEEEKDPALGDT